MSESSRYQNALRYSPGRSVGLYPDARDITQLPIRDVTSRTPIVYAPSVSGVATTDPTLLGQVGDFTSFLPGASIAPPAPPAASGPEAQTPGIDYVGLALRYGPKIANEIIKRLNEPDPNAGGGVLTNPGGLPTVPWGGDQFGYVPAGQNPFGDGGVYWSPEGIPDFNGAIVPGGWDAVGGAAGGAAGFPGSFSYSPAGANAFGGGVYMAPNGTDSLFDGAIVPGLSGPSEASGLGGGLGSGLDFASIGTAGAGAVGGWLANNAAHAIYENNGSPQNIDYGSMAGGALGGLGGAAIAGAGAGVAAGAASGSVVPVIGTVLGALIGGIAGGSINPQPDLDSAYAEGRIGPDGQFNSMGLVRNGGPRYVADNLSQQAQRYFDEQAAARGLSVNPAMLDHGYRFGIGQSDNEIGGWFLQPFGGDPNGPANAVRPDLYSLSVVDPVAQQNALAQYAAQQAAGGDGIWSAGAMNDPTVNRAPASLQEALDAGFQRLVDSGYYTAPNTQPSLADVQANIAQQRDYWTGALANDPSGSVAFNGMDPANVLYNPGWQPPAYAGAPQGPANYYDENGNWIGEQGFQGFNPGGPAPFLVDQSNG